MSTDCSDAHSAHSRPRPVTDHRLIAVLMSTGLLLSACGTDDGTPDAPQDSQAAAAGRSAETGDGGTSEEKPQTVAQDLDAPWSLVFFEGTPLVSERDSAKILELSDETPAKTREVTEVDGVAASGEGGLLGLAVAGDSLFAYSTTATGNRIQRFEISGERGSIELGTPTTIVDGIAKADFHNGGRLALGPDDKLYATVGDAGNRSDAQDRDSLSGSILRMDLDGGVPDDNPFPGSLVYSFGHRNAQGLAWDEEGTMYASEFGQDTWDELNVIEPGGNYGWPEVEGRAEDSDRTANDYIDPVQQWSTDEASPSGITIAGDAILIANLRGESLRQVPLNDTSTSQTMFAGSFGRIRDVAVAPDNDVWFLTNNTDGRGDPADGDDQILRLPMG